jgi:cytochrome c
VTNQDSLHLGLKENLINRMKLKSIFVTAIAVLCCLSVGFSQQKNVLVFSKTAGYRHSSIEPGIAFFKSVSGKEKINFTFSEDAETIHEDNLKKFDAVVFLNTTGDILNPIQQADFERYIQAGGGFVGIHAAADCEYEWPWYNKLVGGYFASHPGGAVSNVQNGKMTVQNPNHPSTKHLPKTFERKDEFYDFKSVKIKPTDVLITVDEKSYQQGKMGDWHPMAWFHEFDGGKVFYTSYGHEESTFTTETDMQKHIIEGLKSVMTSGLDYNKVRSRRVPEENRLVKKTLANNLYEPIELAVMPNGKVLLIERRGDVKVWLPETEEFKTINKIDVFSSFEYGLLGLGLDPNFEKNNYVYLYYTPNTDAHTDQYLSRFVYDQQKNQLILDSEVVMLRVKVKKNECCHTAGSIDWDADGNLYLSTGDDTNPHASQGFAPIDFREGREGWDALRSSGNTNDLRGKILRIKPNEDGTYSIPQGNLYPPGTPGTRPEIFVMGTRNAYRISVDKQTGHLYWGDIGPDAGRSNPERGSEGLVEFNRTTKPGFYGWPIIIGDNKGYNRYNFDTKVSGEKYDPKKPINDSPNNTGLKELPPAQEPFLFYGYGESEKYPVLGKGGANPMAGPVYYSKDHKDGVHKFPDYFDGKFFAYEWVRDWIALVDFDENGKIASMEPFMPNTKFSHPIDMAFSKDGVLYVLEYGPKWFAQNEEAALSKVEYYPNNRPPVVAISANKTIGAAPMKVSFSSEGTKDYDGDKLTYAWDFGGGAESSTEANPITTFKAPGVYTVTLKVTDVEKNTSMQSMQIQVGNEIPNVKVDVAGNKSFYLGDDVINYSVSVNDKEDGSIGKGIKKEDVVISINYLEGYDKNAVTIGHQRNMAYANGRRLIESSDCMACHATDQKSIGPSYKQIAEKYTMNRENTAKLVEKIIGGGGGVWGQTSMAAHPDLSVEAAQSMVRYILSINDEASKGLPAKGKYKAVDHKGKKEGAYVIQASYEDRGGQIIGSQLASTSLALRSPHLAASTYDGSENVRKFNIPQTGEVVMGSNNGWIRFDDIDLTGISRAKVGVFVRGGQSAGGKLELRVDSPTGKLLGETTVSDKSTEPLTIRLNSKVNEKKKLYLVFKNAEVATRPLFGVSFIEFMK